MMGGCDTGNAETEILNAIAYIKNVSQKEASVKNTHMIKHNSNVNKELLKGLNLFFGKQIM